MSHQNSVADGAREKGMIAELTEDVTLLMEEDALVKKVYYLRVLYSRGVEKKFGGIFFSKKAP